VYREVRKPVEPRSNILIEPELRKAPPRPLRWTSEGRRLMLLSLAPAVVVLAIGAALYARDPQPEWKAALFTAFLLFGLAIPLRVALLWRARARLITRGVPVAAAVIAKEGGLNGSTRYFGWYRANGSEWGVGWLGGPEDAEIGDAITVLYSAANPAEAVVYRASGGVALRSYRGG
jgi:hypothetical protein